MKKGPALVGAEPSEGCSGINRCEAPFQACAGLQAAGHKAADATCRTSDAACACGQGSHAGAEQSGTYGDFAIERFHGHSFKNKINSNQGLSSQ
jgi:hypothetical protein